MPCSSTGEPHRALVQIDAATDWASGYGLTSPDSPLRHVPWLRVTPAYAVRGVQRLYPYVRVELSLGQLHCPVTGFLTEVSVSNQRELAPGVRCPVCRERDIREVLHLASIPTNNSIVCTTRTEAEEWPTGSFRLCACLGCGFLYNADFDPALVEYSERTEETQAFSAHFVRYARSLAEHWVERFDIRNKTVLEIGCGKAEFLQVMCEIGNNRGLGYDPAVHSERVVDPAGRLTLTADLFDERHVGVQADALVCRHTLEHIPDPIAFLELVHRWGTLQGENPVVLFEVPDASRILDETAFWDLYYEHCSYFTTDTLRYAFERTGFEVLDVRSTYEGQYLVLEARPRRATGASAIIDLRAARPSDGVAQFSTRFQRGSAKARATIAQLSNGHAAVALWGGGSKAVSLLTSLGIEDQVDYAIDINPNKQGKYLVGTSLEVSRPERLLQDSSALVVVMNPVYVNEVEAKVASLAARATVVSVNDLMEPAPTFTETAGTNPSDERSPK